MHAADPPRRPPPEPTHPQFFTNTTGASSEPRTCWKNFLTDAYSEAGTVMGSTFNSSVKTNSEPWQQARIFNPALGWGALENCQLYAMERYGNVFADYSNEAHAALNLGIQVDHG